MSEKKIRRLNDSAFDFCEKTNLEDLYKDYCKLQSDLSNCKHQIIDLEGQLIIEREIKASTERHYQRSLHDLEHYKAKSVLNKPLYDNLTEKNEERSEINFKTELFNNENIIKKNFELVERNNEIEQQLDELIYKNEDLQRELNDCRQNRDDLTSINEELKLYIDETKEQLKEFNNMQLRINELEEINKADNRLPLLSINIDKINDLELKCYHLEKSNEKLKENHANLMLLGEENASLSSQNERLQQKLQQYEFINALKTNKDVSNNDISFERQERHIERENEILKCQQAEICEEKAELKLKIISLEENVKSLNERNNNYRMLLHDKEKRVSMQEKEIRCLTKDCQSYQNILKSFTEQSNLDKDSSKMLSKLCQITQTLEEHKSQFEQRSIVLDQLIEVIANHVASLESLSTVGLEIVNSEKEIDGRIVLGLRKEVERLNNELNAQSEQLKEAQDQYHNLINEHRSMDQSSDIGLLENDVQRNTKERNASMLKKLSHRLLESVRQVLGYQVELGPNNHVSFHNCLSEDPTELLEFKIEEKPILIDNVYTESIKKQIEYENNFPALLASITLDLVERHANSMF